MVSCNGGSPILGYDRDRQNKAKRLINETEAAIVNRIFEIVCKPVVSEPRQTNSMRAVPERSPLLPIMVNQGEGLLCSRFSARDSHQPRLSRKARSQRLEQEQGPKKPKKIGSRYQLVDAVWEPIVSQHTFERVKQKLRDNREAVPFRSVEEVPVSPFQANPLRMRERFRMTSAHGRNRKYSSYRHQGDCPSGIRIVDAEKLEGAILQRLKKLDATPGLLEASLKNHQAVDSEQCTGSGSGKGRL